MAKQVITITNQVLGGIADTIYLGLKDSVAMMVGFNIHEEPGVLKVNQASAKVSGGIWTDLPKT